ncbi:MAG TPA: phosphatase PAP2 family protein [Thermoanaerobaculia bacterium]|nr:phosphatase PAP2 family protein [Thermoanaerobaculia bacterium]
MEDGRPRLSSTTLARVLSIAGHPFLLVPVMVAVASRNWKWTAIVAAGTVLPLLAITIRNVRRGVWSDHDVSHRGERGGFYRIALPLVAMTTVAGYFLGASPGLMRGLIAAVAMLALGAIGNRFLKISLHTMTAAYFAVVLAKIYPLAAPALMAFVAAICWSRRKLERHTWTEIAVGLLIGAAAAVFAVSG